MGMSVDFLPQAVGSTPNHALLQLQRRGLPLHAMRHRIDSAIVQNQSGLGRRPTSTV